MEGFRGVERGVCSDRVGIGKCLYSWIGVINRYRLGWERGGRFL